MVRTRFAEVANDWSTDSEAVIAVIRQKGTSFSTLFVHAGAHGGDDNLTAQCAKLIGNLISIDSTGCTTRN